MHATAKIKIPGTLEIVQTIKKYGKGLQFCIDTAWKHKIRNNIKLHPFVYKRIKSYGLQSQLAISCIKQACGIVKKAKSKPVINRCSMRYNFPRSASLKNRVLSIATVKGRQKFNIKIPEVFKRYFATWTVRESLLRMDKKGRCFFLFVFNKESPKSKAKGESLGVDLGINNLAVCSNGKFFKSSLVKQIKRKFKHLRDKLQAKGTRATQRLLKKLSGREKRFMVWINHNISKTIVASCKAGDTIVMEDLKGIRKKRRGKRMNYWISNWSFYQLQTFIAYKAERIGAIVKKVLPSYTSQICHKCGVLGTRSKSSFDCKHCGLASYSADLNAARNLAHPMLVERQAAVTQPYGRSVDAKAIVGLAAEFMAKNPTL